MKKILLFLIPTMLITSCSKEEKEINLDDIIWYSENSVTNSMPSTSVSPADLDNLSAVLNPQSSQSRALSYTSSTIFNANGEPCLYVLNFNEGGWAVVSATKKYKPIIAFSSEGEFDMSSTLPGGLQLWKSELINTIDNIDIAVPYDTIKLYQKEWEIISPSNYPSPQVDHYTFEPQFSSYFTKDDYNRLRGIMADSISYWQKKGYTVELFDDVRPLQLLPGRYGEQGITIDDLLQMCDGMIYIEYMENFRFLSCAVYSNKTITEENGPFIKSKWAQDGGYNCTFPMEDGRHMLAGCSPVAVGQLLRFFEHPESYNWSEMPLTYPTATTSDFLYSIGQCMGTSLGLNSSSTNRNNIKNFLSDYFTFNQSNDFSIGELDSKLLNSGLCLISAGWDNIDGRHSWLVGGQSVSRSYEYNNIYTFTEPEKMMPLGNMEQETPLTYGHYYYMNWGWGGLYDGYYSVSHLKYPNNPNSGDAKEIMLLNGFKKK